MRKIGKITGIVLIILIFCISAHATKIHQEDGIFPNHSAEYCRTLNRNASTDADAAFYNPAGLSFMKKNGIYLMFSSQTLYVDRSISQQWDESQQTTFGGSSPSLGYIFVDWSPVIQKDPGYHGVKADKYDVEIFSPATPDFMIVNKSDELAIYFHGGPLLGTPLKGAEFKDGLPVMDWGNLSVANAVSKSLDALLVPFGPLVATSDELKLQNYQRDAYVRRKEMYIGLTLGASYRVMNWISTALGIRFIKASLSTELQCNNIAFDWAPDNPAATAINLQDAWDTSPLGTMAWDVEVEQSGYGWGFIFGTHINPTPELDIGIKGEYYTPLIVKNDTKKLILPAEIQYSGATDIFKDGVETNVQFPPSVSLGVSYKIMPELRVECGVDYYLRKLVDYGPEPAADGLEQYYATDANANNGMSKDQWNNGIRIGTAVEYTIFPELKVSVGYSYYDPGKKPGDRKEDSPLLNSHTYAAGASYKVFDELEITIGGFYIQAITAHVNEERITRSFSTVTGKNSLSKTRVGQEYEESRISIAVGATYRLDYHLF